MVKRRRKEEVEVRTDKVRYHHLNELERVYCVTIGQALPFTSLGLGANLFPLTSIAPPYSTYMNAAPSRRLLRVSITE
jgi:hypothetical protein